MVSERLIDWVILALIVAIAAATRLTFTNLAEFKDDEAKVAMLAVSFLEGKGLPLIGIMSSVGVNNPPAYVYLMSIPFAISRDPAVATAFIGLLGVGGVLLCYRLCDEIFDRRTAQIAALLYAAAPWAVVLSRKMQAQDVVPFFTLLLVGALYRFAQGKGGRHLVMSVVWLNVLVQLHFGSVSLAPLIAAVALLNWRRLRVSAIALAGAVTGVLWAPYLLYQVTHDWIDLRTTLRVGRGATQYGIDHLRWIVEMGSADAYWGRIGPTFTALYTAESALLLLGFAFLAWLTVQTLRRDRADQRYLILALWLVIPPLFWVRHSMPLYPHYFQTVVPTQFIAMGLLLAKVWDLRAGRRVDIRPRPTDDAPTGSPFPAGEGGRGVRSVLRAVVLLLSAALVVTQTYSLFAWMRQIGDGPTPPGYGAPLRDRQTVAEKMVALAAVDNRIVYLAANGADYRSALEFLIGDRLKLKTFDDRDTLLAPPADGGDTYYLISNPNKFAGAYMRQNFADRLVATVPHTSDDRQFEIYRLASGDRARLLANAATPLDRTLPNGIRFLGYTVPPTLTAGGKSTVTLYWQVVSRPPKGEDFGQFFHLVDDGGKAWAKIDGLNYAPVEWQPGDVVTTGAEFDVPPDALAGRYWVEAGFYHRPDLTRLPQTAPDGKTADRARLGPIKLTGAGAATPTPASPQIAHLGDTVDLLGYDLASPIVAPGGSLDLALTWRALKTPTVDYSTFVHLVDASGKLVAQSDGQPGPFPTTLWAPGDTVRDARRIALPAGLPAGEYRLLVGLYRSDTGERLRTPTADNVPLGVTVRVQ